MIDKTIHIGGRVFKAEPSGVYVVSRDYLRGQDLRILANDTVILISDPRPHRTKPIRILGLDNSRQPDFSIVIDYSPCPHCWDNVMSYTTFMLAVQELLKNGAAIGITHVESATAQDGLHHVLHLNRAENKIEDIEAAVETEVDKLLGPLLQFAVQLNHRFKQQFKV